MHQQSLLAFSSTHSRTCACLCPLLKRGSLQERYFLQVSSCQTQSQGGRLPRLCHLGVLRAWFGLRKATHSRMSRLCNIRHLPKSSLQVTTCYPSKTHDRGLNSFWHLYPPT